MNVRAIFFGTFAALLVVGWISQSAPSVEAQAPPRSTDAHPFAPLDVAKKGLEIGMCLQLSNDIVEARRAYSAAAADALSTRDFALASRILRVRSAFERKQGNVILARNAAERAALVEEEHGLPAGSSAIDCRDLTAVLETPPP